MYQIVMQQNKYCYLFKLLFYLYVYVYMLLFYSILGISS